ncbi:MAG: redoxin family protein [Bdellovibrionales bacterium]|nr:redoxin family protein [Bdellovibrionales bacterium]
MSLFCAGLLLAFAHWSAHHPALAVDVESTHTSFANTMTTRKPPSAQVPGEIARRLVGASVPGIPLPCTDGTSVDLRAFSGLTVVVIVPGPSNPNNLPSQEWLAGWTKIPGAAGCTGECKAFNRTPGLLPRAGIKFFVLTGQAPDVQRELSSPRALSLGFPMLSDENGEWAEALGLPRFEYDGKVYHPRITLLLQAGEIKRVISEIPDPSAHVDTVYEVLTKEFGTSLPREAL